MSSAFLRACVLALVSSALFLGSPARPIAAAPGSEATTPSYTLQRHATRIDVEPDGRFRTRTETTVSLADAAAIERWGSVSVPFQRGVEDVRLSELRVTKADGRERALEIPASEDVSLTGAFDGPVYSDIHLRHFTIPSLEPGDVLHYRIDEDRLAPLAPGHFWTEYRFTRDAVVLDETLEIVLPAGRRFIVKVRDGAGVEVVPFDATGGRQGWRWRHRQPSVPEATDAANAARLTRLARGRLLDPADVQVTSFEDWAAVARWYAGLADSQAVADAAVKQQVASLTSQLPGPRERLTALHRFVTQSVRYVSLAFGMGHYQPRPAPLVLSTQYGDCKDKHTLLQAMAASIGIAAEPVLIASQRELDPAVPSPAQFDHVITMVHLADGGTLWIDGTTPYLPAGSLASVLRDKQGLRVGEGEPRLVRTPAGPRPSIRIDITGRVAEDGQVTLRVRSTPTGDIEFGLRSALADVRDADLVKTLGKVAAAYGLEKSQITAARKGDARNLAERFWLEIEFAFGVSFDAAKAWQFWLPTERLALPEVPAGSTADVDASLWVDQEVHARLEVPEGLVVHAPLPVSVTRDVASFSSTYGAAKGAITLDCRFTVSAASLPASGFDGFSALRRAVESDYNQRFTVEPFAGTASAGGSDADRLRNEGYRKLDAHEYAEAETLLKRALTLKPDHKYAWVDLGRALHGQRRFQEAIDAYDRQIALNAYDEWAWNNRGWSEWALKKLEQAEASFRKQIEIDPLHKNAHTNLGNLLAERKRWSEARAVLETAARLQPENGTVHLQLAKATAESGAKSEALPIFEKAVTLARTPSAWNDAAWYMVEHGLDLDTALRYARSAVSALAAATNEAAPDSMKPAARAQRAVSLSACWDTLGWIQFKRGDTAEALRYLSSAWQVYQNAEVGEHLGRALERAGRRRDALLAYKAALSLPRPSESLAAAARALAKNPPSGEWTTDGETLSIRARSHRVPRTGGRAGSSEVFLAVDETGRIVEAREATDSAFGEPLSGLVGTRLSFNAPDQAPLRVELLGALSCPSRGPACTLILRASNGGESGGER